MNVRTVRNASGLARQIIGTIRHAACSPQCGVSQTEFSPPGPWEGVRERSKDC
jgi:hypothetical protein